MKGIVKRFGDVLALDHVSLTLKRGEVHALLGENGAGKTTLMNVLFGLYRANEGEIYVEGREVTISDPRDALANGIGMVHQHFKLISNFTAMENILLGTGKGLKFDVAGQSDKVAKIEKEYGLSVDLGSKIKAMPVGAQQRVEILKVLMRDPKVLILDEPTSSLTPQEADVLLSAIKKLSKNGLSVVFITHKVREVMAIADVITVLKGGRLMGTVAVSGASEEKLVELMMGGKEFASPLLSAGEARPKVATGTSEKVLQVADLVVEGAKGVIAVDGANFDVGAGEILGVAGVSGNGQRELAEAIMAVRRPKSGSVKLRGVELTSLNPHKVIGLGVSYIPEDRMGDGLLPTMTVAENLLLSHHDVPPYAKGIAVNYEVVSEKAEQAVHQYNVKTPSIQTHAGRLSGGNIQKILIARAMLTPSKAIVAHNPTRGLDIATTNFVMKNLVEQKKSGAAVVLISEDLDELMLISDRILTLFGGKVMGIVEPSLFDKYRIGAMMAGEPYREGAE
ncbi:MAG TPA: ABC transporter ATP-binding protein [Conexivisphaerales archaeon]|nr:ABC transporter ATP-binding protein [Conexivisphaerales archaeon]